ncbi:MAG: hypothetical protein V3V89_05700 [Gammaproteobacteria bacterium]
MSNRVSPFEDPNFQAKVLALLMSKPAVLKAYREALELGFFYVEDYQVIAGYIFEHFDLGTVFLFDGIIALAWLFFTFTMPEPAERYSFTIKLGKISKEQVDDLVKRLMSVTGVVEAMVIAEDGTAYLKVDSSILDHQALNAISSDTV